MSQPEVSAADAAAAGRLLDAAQVQAYQGPQLVLFIGISTAGSRVHDTFPRWAPLLCPGAVLRGVDLPPDASPAQFRELVSAMAANPCVNGAVITSHKLRLHNTCADLLDDADPLVDLTHEINSLDTRDGVRAFARDPQSLDVIIDDIGGQNDEPARRPMLCIGAGGSAIALMIAMRLDILGSLSAQHARLRTKESARGPLTIVGRREESLDEIRAVQKRCGIGEDAVRMVLAADPYAVAQQVESAPARTVVINATGLGKTEPGSPLPDTTTFPPSAVAWDFNYRGPLNFLEQARRAKTATEDGWNYFVAGWAAALAAIAGTDLTPQLLSNALREAREFMPQ